MLEQEHGPHPCLLAHLVRPSFIFSMVRDPAARCLSEFYHFGVTCGNVTPTDEHKLAALRTCEDIQYRSLRFHYEQPVKFVVTTYHFIGVVERFDTSMAVLADVIGVPLASILYTRSKDSSRGGVRCTFASQTWRTRFVSHGPIDDEPPAVASYARSDAFRAANANDFALIDGANARIDQRIAGSSLLARRVSEYTALLAAAQAACQPTNQWGHKVLSLDRSQCYARDNGCNYKCLDEFSSSRVAEAAHAASASQNGHASEW